MGLVENLNRAKELADDEYYTLYETVAREVECYPGVFSGKVVYCNCDDPGKSQFFRYFLDHFRELGLKRLICSCYRFRHKDLLSFLNDEEGLDPAVWCEVEDPDEPIVLREHEEDGDFRSWESVRLLRESDVVVTNPPFSLFRDFVEQLRMYRKDFLVLGNMNAVTYKVMFGCMVSGEVRVGYTQRSGGCDFVVPRIWYNEDREFRRDGEGRYIISLGQIRWYTTLRGEMGIYELECRYDSEKYPRYDNYDAIEVSRLRDIPMDYGGVMGVPITFFDVYNSDQFEVLGQGDKLLLGGEYVYKRVLVRRRV